MSSVLSVSVRFSTIRLYFNLSRDPKTLAHVIAFDDVKTKIEKLFDFVC